MANRSPSELDPRTLPKTRKTVPLDRIEIDRATQARLRLQPAWVDHLKTDVLDRGVAFEQDPEVYFDGDRYWVGDGFHRVEAYKKDGRERIPCWVREGGYLQAMIHAAGANYGHGLPRTQSDIRRAIKILLVDADLANRSDRTLAVLARTTHPTVAAVRRELHLDGSKRLYTDKHGNESEMDTSKIGKSSPKRQAEAVTSFKDIPEPVRDRVRQLLFEIGRLSGKQGTAVFAWLKARLPNKGTDVKKVMADLDTELVMQSDDEEGDD